MSAFCITSDRTVWDEVADLREANKKLTANLSDAYKLLYNQRLLPDMWFPWYQSHRNSLQKMALEGVDKSLKDAIDKSNKIVDLGGIVGKALEEQIKLLQITRTEIMESNPLVTLLY